MREKTLLPSSRVTGLVEGRILRSVLAIWGRLLGDQREKTALMLGLNQSELSAHAGKTGERAKRLRSGKAQAPVSTIKT